MKLKLFLSLGLVMAGCTSYHNIDPIRRTLLTKQGDFVKCHQASDSFKAGKHGVVYVSFTITNDGKIHDEKIAESAMNDAGLHSCLLNHIKTLSFDLPENEGTIKVRQPIGFYP